MFQGEGTKLRVDDNWGVQGDLFPCPPDFFKGE